MYLTKSCDSKDNAMQRGTVKLGTLDHYRKSEIEQIADKGEGQLTFELQIRTPTQIEIKWLNTFQPNVQLGDSDRAPVEFEGNIVCNLKELGIVSADKSQALVDYADISIKREAPNALVFCMSMAETKEDCRQIFPNYNDQWHIFSDSKEVFSQHLGLALLELLREPDHGGLIDPSLPFVGLSLHCEYQPAVYANRHTRFDENSKIELNHFLNLMKTMAFIKPLSYAHEREYRFSFHIRYQGKTLPLLKDHAILPLSNKFLELVF